MSDCAVLAHFLVDGAVLLLTSYSEVSQGYSEVSQGYSEVSQRLLTVNHV